jgi:hypothetical protein
MTDTPQEYQLLRISFGTIKGTVQTVSNRDGLKIILYDSIFDAPVICHLDDSQLAPLQNILGKKVIVTGRIIRHSETGHPISIENIADISLAHAGNYQVARGIFDWQEGDEPAEITIRRLRDGED